MRQENLQQAEYKGVRFACNDTETEIGRAKIPHSFANSDVDNIEDQGRNPRIYRLTAVINGVDYRVQRDALMDAIDGDGSPGTLIHPFHGRIENAVAMPGVVFPESVKTLGRIEITITFRISDSDGIPSATRISTSGISNRRESTIAAVTEDFTEKYTVTNNFPGNYSSAQSKANNLVSSIRAFVTTTSISSSRSAGYFSKVDSFSRNINGLVNNSKGMGEGITELIEDISGLYDIPVQTLTVAQRFFTFGEDDIPINPTTAGLIERQRNNTAFNEAVQVSALSISYEAASLIDYRTVDEIENVQRDLEGKYEALRF